MFEIPDHEDDFWENIPLAGDDFQKNSTPQKLAPKRASSDGFVEDFASKCPMGEVLMGTECKTTTSTNSTFSTGVIPAAALLQSMHSISKANYMNSNDHADQNRASFKLSTISAYTSANQNKDTSYGSMFNLTQSSEESDLDLSLPFQCSTGSRSQTPPVNSTSGRQSYSSFAAGQCCDKPDIDINRGSVSAGTAMVPSNNYTPSRTTASISTPTVHGHTNQFNIDKARSINQFSTAGRENIASPSLPVHNRSLNKRMCRVEEPSPSTSFGDCHVNPRDPRIDVHRQRKRSGVDTPKSSRAKRKFPGPAGLLPRLSADQSLDAASPDTVHPVESVRSKEEGDVVMAVSQSAVDAFSEAAWQALETDLGEDCMDILDRFSITNMLLKAGKKQLPSGKVPLLFAVVDSMDIQGADACVVLRDKTGKMQGTVHRELLKDMDTRLHQGVVLVLKQVGVISPTPRNHYLNITPINVVSVYSLGADGAPRVTHGEEETSLSSTISSADTQLREVPAVGTPNVGRLISQPGAPMVGRLMSQPGTPMVGRLLSQPGTPISSVPMSPSLFQNTHNSVGVFVGPSTPTGYTRSAGISVPTYTGSPSVRVPQFQSTASNSSYQQQGNLQVRTPLKTDVGNARSHYHKNFTSQTMGANVQQPNQKQFTNPLTPHQTKSKWKFKPTNSPILGSSASLNSLSSSRSLASGVGPQNLTASSNNFPALQAGFMANNLKNNDSDYHRSNSNYNQGLASGCAAPRIDINQFSMSENGLQRKKVTTDPNNNGHSNSPVLHQQQQMKRNIMGQKYESNLVHSSSSDSGNFQTNRYVCYQSSPKYSFKKPSQHATVSVQSATMATMSRNQNDVNSFWHDDLTDEMLTEMTAEDFP